MIVIRIDLEHPHLARYFAKKYYNKLYGTKFRSIKVLDRYSRQLDKRKLNDFFENPIIKPMESPPNKIFFMPLSFNTNVPKSIDRQMDPPDLDVMNDPRIPHPMMFKSLKVK